MKALKKLSCLFLALCVVLALPVQALAETYYLEDGSVVVTTDETSQYVAQGTDNAVPQTTETVITQRAPETPTSNTITIDTSTNAGAKPAEVTIQDVNIKPTSAESAITVTSGSSAEITVQGENKVEGGYAHAGVSVAEGTSLTITAESTGSLDAKGSFGSAGIGGSQGSGPSGNNVDGGDGENAGTVTINGGAITATAGISGTGIGGGEGHRGADSDQDLSRNSGNGGNGGNGGTVTINGGTVTVKGYPSIGGGMGGDGGNPSGNYGTDGDGGNGGNGGTVTINGGTLTIQGDPIGGGLGGNGDNSKNGENTILEHNGGALTTKDGTTTSKPDLPLPGQEPTPAPPAGTHAHTRTYSHTRSGSPVLCGRRTRAR